MTENLINRITYHLSSGGLFNPELADHLAVRNLLMECREALAQPEQDWIERERAVGYREGHQNALKQMAQLEQEQLMSDQINYGMSVTQGGKRIDPMSIYKEPEQEPVTWRYKIVDVFGRPAWTLKTPKSDTRVLESQPLYTTPPQRKPLTDEEIAELWLEILGSTPASGVHEDGLQPWRFARAIEAAHGIYAPTERKGEA